ncbi:MAG: transcriptional regulator [Pseudohongiellaceae bacterium]|jgi:transcriptional regulator
MFIPNHFDASDQAKIAEFLNDNSFGDLVSIVDGRPLATPAAFLFDDEREILSLHIARANPQWQTIEGEQVFFIANGPHGYISPSWYADAGVPTWNYQAVHFNGIATVFSEPARLKLLVNELTARSEKRSPKPWLPSYPESMLRGIVGIEIAISEIQCKFKLSQNRSVIDQKQSIQALEDLGNSELARVMRKENNLD